MAKKHLPKPKPLEDVAVVGGPTEDGAGARVLRFKAGNVYAGEVRPAREGQPIEQHELVRLRPLHPQLPVCAVEVLHDPANPSEQGTKSSGPSRVSTPVYRRNWHAIFGAQKKAGSGRPAAGSKPKRGDDWSVN